MDKTRRAELFKIAVGLLVIFLLQLLLYASQFADVLRR